LMARNGATQNLPLGTAVLNIGKPELMEAVKELVGEEMIQEGSFLVARKDGEKFR